MAVLFPRAYLDELRSRTRLSDLVRRCGVKLVRQGREFVGLCPFHRERTPSFSVVDERHFFHCFGCGAHGDVIEFIRRHDNLDFTAAIGKLAGELAVDIRPPDNNNSRPRPVDQREDEEERRRRIAEARRLWDRGRDPRGTPVERYLHIRGVDLPPSPVLRFYPRCWNKETGQELPAMLARVDGPDGAFVAVHRTWLRPEGSGKADLRWPKKSRGPIRGGAVRLAPAARRLAIAEGIENALTVMVATGLPAWSAVSAGGIRRLVLPREVEEVVIVADCDSNGVGQGAAQSATERWLAEGRRVLVAFPPDPDIDLNNVLMAM